MIANYYKLLKYNVRGSDYYNGDAGLVNHLYNEMGSTMLGTSLTDFASGLFKHLEHDDKNTIWRGLRFDHPTGNYTEFWDAINTMRPVGIRYDFWVNNDAPFNYHFVVGNGVKPIFGTDYFGFVDPDSGKDNKYTNWYAWSAQAKNFDMHLTMPQKK
ncbi:hypothetical protein M3650_04075 [Paenibacillus sp. MER TA 81-3]|nr:hypothetical protein [Paenibacillus sp. MER TA 81-3]